MKIGIFGGTFDPVHIGHLIIAEYFRMAYALDRVLFIPAFISPFKQASIREATDRQRLDMLQMAIASNPHFAIDLYEIDKGEVSYSYSTIAYLRKKYPDDQLYMIIGEDNAERFYQWHFAEDIVKSVEILVYPRTGYAIDRFAENTPYARHMTLAATPIFEISSTSDRELLKSDDSIRYLVPDNVLQFIEQNKLYR
jgi:nicotinate-nucleotide adenylyltransferase